jgi:hypothetical protein
MSYDREASGMYHGLASVALVTLGLANLGSMAFSLTDIAGGRTLTTAGVVTGSKLVFGTGGYFVFLIAAPIVLLGLFWLFEKLDYKNCKKGTSERKMFSWPRYVWDSFTLIGAQMLSWMLITSLIIVFWADKPTEFDMNVSFGAGTLGSPAVERYNTLSLLVIVLSFLNVHIVVDMIFAYLPRMYYTEKVDRLGLSKDSMISIKQTLKMGLYTEA